jgi:hypothetical protein
MRSILISQRIHVAVFDFHRDSAEPSSEAANIGDPDVKLHKRNYAHRTKPLPRLLTFKQYRRLQRKVFAKALGPTTMPPLTITIALSISFSHRSSRIVVCKWHRKDHPGRCDRSRDG